MKPFWVTFYSYKGGVGRSLALANTAALLAKKGRRVVLIDFDLEAPGLDSFDEFSQSSERPGVVEYVSEYLREGRPGDIRQYIYECELPAHIRGQMFLMPAGRKDVVYSYSLANINWSSIYEEKAGALFFQNWKLAIEKEFRPDYVFVDSRTGLTEVGGVCTTQFPDLVVMLFGLNDQNVEGVCSVAKSIREAGSDAVPLMHFVASPVPNLPPEQRVIGKRGAETRGFLAERMMNATERLGSKAISSIRYFAPAALSEKLFVLDEAMADQLIVSDYEKLYSEIVNYNRRGLDALLDQSNVEVESGDLDRALKIAEVANKEFPNNPEALIQLAKITLLRGAADQARELAEKAFDIDPTLDSAVRFLRLQYNKAADWNKIVELYERQLQFKGRLGQARVISLYHDYAEMMMVIGRYAPAMEYYGNCAKLAKEKSSLSIALCYGFNFAEASRRATGVINVEQWQEVIDLFEKSGAASDGSMPAQANQWQAMHIAYACVGNIGMAREALKKAKRIALMVGDVEEVYSVAVYRHVSAAEFLSINTNMEQSLDLGLLWDGMRIGQR